MAGVNSHIKVQPRVEVSDLQNRIEDALKRNAEIEAEGIGVSVKNGAVVLTGLVHGLSEHEAIKQAVWSAPGVRSVDDHLRVSD